MFSRAAARAPLSHISRGAGRHVTGSPTPPPTVRLAHRVNDQPLQQQQQQQQQLPQPESADTQTRMRRLFFRLRQCEKEARESRAKHQAQEAMISDLQQQVKEQEGHIKCLHALIIELQDRDKTREVDNRRKTQDMHNKDSEMDKATGNTQQQGLKVATKTANRGHNVEEVTRFVDEQAAQEAQQRDYGIPPLPLSGGVGRPMTNECHAEHHQLQRWPGRTSLHTQGWHAGNGPQNTAATKPPCYSPHTTPVEQAQQGWAMQPQHPLEMHVSKRMHFCFSSFDRLAGCRLSFLLLAPLNICPWTDIKWQAGTDRSSIRPSVM
ncbi:unnamed protein product [Vitrella brassicaformis CCMP3155]|uniref:Uncharacterized protein n=1 Tax=Vitrella brassicaformis (strain CCMP3155) TaxID=1169540 RepID=A0A0G4G5F7_VITBC|nr:unnamed protein product [Vitrella brassicaformis CCMP3155]|eukprot:CEM23470.1 unnamed protein product [Vitrella brassicaformis CCMP3155]